MNKLTLNLASHHTQKLIWHGTGTYTVKCHQPFKGNYRRIFLPLGSSQFLRIQKTETMREIDKLDFIKILKLLLIK